MSDTQNDRHAAGISRCRMLQRSAGVAAVLMVPAILRPAHAQGITCHIAMSGTVGSPLSNTVEIWAAMLREQSGGAIKIGSVPTKVRGATMLPDSGSFWD